MELMLDSKRLVTLAHALSQLGYKPVERAKFYQFMKPGPDGGTAGSLKVDLLTGPQRMFDGCGMKVDKRRVRPRTAVDLHAHPVDEALTLEEGLLEMSVDGQLSNGTPNRGTVYLPHPFTFLMMKLFALSDQVHDAEKGFGRHHALDLYTVIGMMTEVEWRTAMELRQKHSADAKVNEARKIVATLFANEECLGVLRLKESPYCRPDFQVKEFIKALGDVLG